MIKIIPSGGVSACPKENLHLLTKMMSSEKLEGISFQTLRPLSPELQLGTMSTADIFDTRWECGVSEEGEEIDLESRSLSISPISSLLQDNLYEWDNDEVLESNLLGDFKENLEGDVGLLLASDFQLDMSLLHDSASNMSDISSSSSTITSSSIPPQSPGSFSTIFEDIDTPQKINESMKNTELSDKSGNKPVTFSVEETIVFQRTRDQDVSQKVQHEDSCVEKQAKSTSFCKRQKKFHHSPQKMNSQCSHSVTKSPEVVPSPTKPISQLSRYKQSVSENHMTREEKLIKFMKSNIKWSELSGSDQWIIGEGLNSLLSQSLGVREKLEVLKILGYPTTSHKLIITTDLNLAAVLNDSSLEAVRHYLRVLESENLDVFKKLLKGKNNKLSVKHNFKKTPRKGKKLKESGGEENSYSPAVFSVSTFPVTKVDEAEYHSESNTNTESCSEKVKKSLRQTSRLNKKGKMYTSGVIPQVNQRSRKEYRQMLKEKRSGLFKEEVVLCVSAVNSNSSSSLSDSEEVDVLE